MPGEDIYSWSTVAADNGNADTLINWVEGQTRASVNNSSRSEMAAHAKNRNQINGSIVTTGSANAQAFLSGNTYTTIPTNMFVRLKVGPGLTNTGSTTLNMDGIGATLVVDTQGANLRGNEFTAGDYAEMIWNGTNWVFLYSYSFFNELIRGGGGVIIGLQKFTVPGAVNYIPTPGTESIIVECIGGGGGGGGAYQNTATGAFGGGGGGSGGYSRSILNAAQFGMSVVVTVGFGGGGGGTMGAGFAGADSSFGAFCIAKGGSAGDASVGNTSVGAGGAGGAGGAVAGALGDITAAGAPGANGMYSDTAGPVGLSGSGAGGSSAFGGGGVGVAGSPLNGIAGGNYGSGGGGGVDWFTNVGLVGGGGSSGIIIVTEFAGRGLPGIDGATGPIGPVGPSGSGTGDVLRSGTPTAGQIAQWIDASHIAGVAPQFTTGDTKTTFKTVADAGWVMMSDGSIGNAASAATSRANADTVNLFTLLYDNIPSLPLQDSAGATVARGASAAVDYAANRRLVLPQVLGRSLAIAGAGSGLSARPLGTTAGAESHILALGEMPSHNHPQNLVMNNTTSQGQWVKGVGDSTGQSTDLQGTGFVGGGAPFTLIDPTTYLNIMIKL